jgi:rod shape determining protein RodA
LALVAINILVQFSANNQNTSRIYNDVVYLAISLVVMFIVAGFNYKNLQNIAVPLYALSIILLVAVFFLGIKVNGAQRWLNVGIRIQPSELCKIAVPLMVAYYLAKQDEVLGYRHYLVAALIILLPFLLIAKQPDLGTAILVLLSGFFVLFFANLPWKAIILGGLATIMALPLFWLLLKDYQKYRVLTLIDPQSDPLGKGYHIIQSIIAIGSGGIYGKGYLQGSQIHLDFIPEKSTDFIITV